jgi:hypothetical protein
MMDWQPEETAPKNETRILAIWAAHGEYAVVRWSAEEASWLEGGADYVSGFTHWMPLPPAPEARHD